MLLNSLILLDEWFWLVWLVEVTVFFLYKITTCEFGVFIPCDFDDVILTDFSDIFLLTKRARFGWTSCGKAELKFPVLGTPTSHRKLKWWPPHFYCSRFRSGFITRGRTLRYRLKLRTPKILCLVRPLQLELGDILSGMTASVCSFTTFHLFFNESANSTLKALVGNIKILENVFRKIFFENRILKYCSISIN